MRNPASSLPPRPAFLRAGVLEPPHQRKIRIKDRHLAHALFIAAIFFIFGLIIGRLTTLNEPIEPTKPLPALPSSELQKPSLEIRA